MNCTVCNGKGYIDDTCQSCNGSGEGMHDGLTCLMCHGSGVQTIECEACNGTGDPVRNCSVCGEYEKYENTILVNGEYVCIFCLEEV